MARADGCDRLTAYHWGDQCGRDDRGPSSRVLVVQREVVEVGLENGTEKEALQEQSAQHLVFEEDHCPIHLTLENSLLPTGPGADKLTRKHRQHGHLPLNHDKRNQAQSPDNKHGDHHRRVPVKVRAAARDRDQQEDDPDRRSNDAVPVDPTHTLPEAILAVVVRDEKVPDRHAASRQRGEQPEEAAPGGPHREGRGNEGADHVAQAQRGAQNPLVLASLLERHDIGDDDHRQRGDAPACYAGQPAEEIEHGRVHGQSAEQVGETEEGQRAQIDDLAAEDVG